MLKYYSRSVFVVLKNRTEFSSFALHNTCLLTHLTVSIDSYQILINWINRGAAGSYLVGWLGTDRRWERRGGEGKVGEGSRGWGSSTAVNLTSPIQPSRAAMLLAVVTLCGCVCLSCASDIITLDWKFKAAPKSPLFKLLDLLLHGLIALVYMADLYCKA